MAGALCCATFPLIFVGGLVTSTDAGMAVPDWPGTFGYNLFLYPWATWFFGPWDLFVEHGHRLLAAMVGMLAVAVCAVAVGTRCPRLIAASAALLLLVIVQGVLGGMRVLLDQRVLALAHGCTGPLCFLATILFWNEVSQQDREAARKRFDTEGITQAGSRASAQVFAGFGRFFGISLLLLCATYAQVVLGAFLRHGQWLHPLSFRSMVVFHVLFAVMLFMTAARLAWACFSQRELMARGEREKLATAQEAFLEPARPDAAWPELATEKRALAWLAFAILVAVVCQVLLGVGTWLLNYGWPWGIEELARYLPSGIIADVITAREWRQVLVTTAHVALGSLILGWTGLLTLRTWRLRTGLNLPGRSQTFDVREFSDPSAVSARGAA
jgi:cytochrome c oxidase assembly protein subunit 15